jgi:hypothetical protein
MREKLQRALSKITVLVSNSTKAHLGPAQQEELKSAIVFLHNNWPSAHPLKSRAMAIRDSVCASGIISSPTRKAAYPQHILRECEALLKCLDEQGPSLWSTSN